MKLKSFLLALVSFVLLLSNTASAQVEKANIVFASEMPNISNPDTGDYPELAGMLAALRKQPTPTFFLFGGGSIGPSSMSAFDRGSHIIDILNTLEPDAMGITKREFSYFEDELSLRSYEAAFPMISSNLFDPLTKQNLDGIANYALIEKSGLKLGVISVLDESVIEEYLLSRVEIKDAEKAVKATAETLREMGADYIVLMYSNDFPFVQTLLEEEIINLSFLTDPHFWFSNRQKVPNHPNSIYLTEAGQVAQVSLSWNGEKTKALEVTWASKLLLDYPRETRTRKQVGEYVARLNRLLDEHIGTLETTMDTRRNIVRGQESAFGNFVADALREFFETDIAFINGGAIRGEKIYQPGTALNRRDIAKELPFRSQIMLLKIDGKTLREAVENGLSQVEDNKGKFLHLSGINAIYDSSEPPGKRLKSLIVAEREVSDEQVFRLATSDYLSSGGDGFEMLLKGKVFKLNTRVSPMISDVVINSIRQKRKINPKAEGRLIDLNENNL